MCWINGKRPRLNVPPDNHATRRAVDVWHLNALCAGVNPVEIVCNPVDNYALWWVKVEVNHMLRDTSVDKCTVDALQKPHQNERSRTTYHITGTHSFIHSFISGMHHYECVYSAKRRHQSADWAILSHVNCFVQGEVHWSQVLLGSLHPRSMRELRTSHLFGC